MRTLINIFIISIMIMGVMRGNTYCQKSSYAGLNFTVESSSNGFRPGIGGLFERKIKKHSGFETGIYYRNYILKGITTYTDSTGSRSFPFTVSERHLSIPALYKFYSRLINLSAGPTFDFYLGWKQRNKTSLVNVDAYNIDPNFFIGLMAKVSKTILLNDRMLLEPEFRFNHILTSYRTYVGFGIAGKYRLP